MRDNFLKISAVLVTLLFTFYNCNKDNPDNPTKVKDKDGNVYKTVKIGTQTWLVENLKTTHYQNGDPIATVSDNSQWSTQTAGACCDYENNSANTATYGKMYNWFAATDTRGICPTGWHVPSDSDWWDLSNTVGNMCAKLKETGTAHWSGTNSDATNETGFTALPGGNRESNGNFQGQTYNVYYWSTKEHTATSTWAAHMNHVDANFMISAYMGKKNGFFIRCLKD